MIESAGDIIPVEDAIRAALDVAVAKSRERLIVAVSGGRDSMSLMHALARWFPDAVAAIATFDHGSGPAATEAAGLVAAEARRLGLTVIRERARSVAATEDAWRKARWAFLKRVARGYKGVVATAHTRDDQLETIVLRVLRGSGARGLAALAAPSTIVRPWLPLSRDEVAAWAAQENIQFVSDPTNFTHKYFRSRVRLDLLPALEAVQPGFADAMLGIGENAAKWRREVDALVDELGVRSAIEGSPRGAMRVSSEQLRTLDDEGLAVVWPALLGRIGVALNRRGTVSVVRFTRQARTGMRLELAGGASVVRVREGRVEEFEFRPPIVKVASASPSQRQTSATLPLRFFGWRFKPTEAPAVHTEAGSGGELWAAPLATEKRYEVRLFRDGDRIRTHGAPAGRRVARYLSEAHIPTVDRRQWPVVVDGDEIVWVPGVCRSIAVPYRSGRPAVIWYRCEREHG